MWHVEEEIRYKTRENYLWRTRLRLLLREWVARPPSGAGERRISMCLCRNYSSQHLVPWSRACALAGWTNGCSVGCLYHDFDVTSLLKTDKISDILFSHAHTHNHRGDSAMKRPSEISVYHKCTWSSSGETHALQNPQKAQNVSESIIFSSGYWFSEWWP